MLGCVGVGRNPLHVLDCGGKGWHGRVDVRVCESGPNPTKRSGLQVKGWHGCVGVRVCGFERIVGCGLRGDMVL